MTANKERPTYCTNYIICKNGYKCDKILTKQVIEAANVTGETIEVYEHLPDCFVAFWAS